eukprot:TRINITY_DN1094_c3_g1_i1.p1 TRINITY_DN1094_c3_g1~~TRINITY_DN1094_c3_g1_i1.p1  ORF type:complete len:410 (-),score=51.60 TRINITY_DN1094_c3_g1_i1:37-1266(-)
MATKICSNSLLRSKAAAAPCQEAQANTAASCKASPLFTRHHSCRDLQATNGCHAVGKLGRNNGNERALQRYAVVRKKTGPRAMGGGEGTTTTATLVSGSAYPMPDTAEEEIEQAQGALKRALADGLLRQQMRLLLPIDQRKFNFLDTEPRDYPCSIREEFISAKDVMTAVMRGAIGGADVSFRRIGEAENEMDPVGLLSAADKTVGAVVFPIAESLKQIESLVKTNPGTAVVIVNAQWSLTPGAIVSDFGFGPWKKQAEEFVESFQLVYSLEEQRIGEASNVVQGVGGVVRILKCYPGDWQVFLMGEWDGISHLIHTQRTKPSYKELEPIVAEARKIYPWKAPPRMMGSEPAPPPNPKQTRDSGLLTDEEIDGMDSVFLRRALMSLNLPSSGRASVLRDRLKAAQIKNE